MHERLKELRKKLGLTQQEFADALGIARGNISAYEVAKNSLSDAVIALICKTFDISEEWLRTGAGDMRIQRSPEEEVAIYVEELLDYEGSGNPFYDAIIEMMKTYINLDSKSQAVIQEFFRKTARGIGKEKEEA